MLATGARGTGKTVLLNALEDVAREVGWVIVSETARRGLVRELVATTLPALASRQGVTGESNRATAVAASAMGFGGPVSRQLNGPAPVEPSLRSQLTELASALSRRGSGVFLTLDEVHRAERQDVAEFFQAIQHAFREGLPVAVAAADLPAAVNAILHDDVLAFLRRARLWKLGRVPDALVASAPGEPIALAGRSISREALDLAVRAVRGYPFLIQVVGCELWAEAPAAFRLTWRGSSPPCRGRSNSRTNWSTNPLWPTCRPVTAPSCGRWPSWGIPMCRWRKSAPGRGSVSCYRARLTAAEAVEPSGRGRLSFTLPLLGEISPIPGGALKNDGDRGGGSEAARRIGQQFPAV
ncbi:MAG: ATP-binding protein [Bifidobacteriaceae bacterium]|nr:ATP-binding protein [Bifidobacteriaceae bacterium]